MKIFAVYFEGDARDVFRGERSAQRRLAAGAHAWTEISPADLATGTAHFDGEWAFVAEVMSALGYAQLLREGGVFDANEAEEIRERLDDLGDAMIAPEARAFDAAAWGSDPLEDMRAGQIERPHAGYLSYLALALTALRVANPNTRHRELQESLIHFLIDCSRPVGGEVLPSFPNAYYPPDNALLLGALGLHSREFEPAIERDFQRAINRFVETSIDEDTGLLRHTLHRRRNWLRGSASAVSVYALAYADLEVSRRLDDAVREQLHHHALGFSAIDEFHAPGGRMDFNSGPVIFGWGVSASGFSLAGARIHGDEERFVGLSVLAAAVGGARRGHTQQYALGGPLGDTLLFAMRTATARSTFGEAE